MVIQYCYCDCDVVVGLRYIASGPHLGVVSVQLMYGSHAAARCPNAALCALLSRQRAVVSSRITFAASSAHHRPTTSTVCQQHSSPVSGWTTVCKTVHPMLSDRFLSVCNVGVLWPNGWMDQDATWYGARPRPRRHCVRLASSSPCKGAQHPDFSAHVYCGQTVAHLSYC